MLKLNYKILSIDYTYKINIYKMSLYIITRITFLNISYYYIIFVFLSVETVDDYYWILGAIRKLYEFFDFMDSKVIITNTNPSIIYTILEGFLLTSYLLYP